MMQDIIFFFVKNFANVIILTFLKKYIYKFIVVAYEKNINHISVYRNKEESNLTEGRKQD